MRPWSLLALGLLLGCAEGAPTGVTDDFAVQFVATNHLLAPVTILVDGEPYLVLKGGASSPVTVSSRAQWLTWTSAKPMDAAGRQIRDDIGEIRVGVGGLNRELQITNVIADQTYITARFLNSTAAAVSIGVFDGDRVACAAALPARAGIVSGYTQIGYYRLRAATEIRAYRHPTDCTGTYTAWPAALLREYGPRSGLLTLFLDSAP